MFFFNGCCDATCSSWCTTTALVNKILRSIATWDMMKQELSLSQSLPQALPNCDNGCKILGTIYRRMTFSTFMTVFMRVYTPELLPDGGTVCIDVTVWEDLTVTCVFPLI